MSYKQRRPIIVSEGGTGNTTLTLSSVLLGNSASPITQLPNGTTGQVLSAVTGLDPVWATLGASTVSITGDTGGAIVSGSFTFTGGTTGLSFGGAGTTETLTFAGITANGGAVALGTDNAGNAITIGTGTVARNINIGLSAAPHVISIGVNNGASSLGLNAGTGDMTLISGDAITLDAAGLLELNSTGGAISIGNDANNFAVNIATAGTRTINLGSATATIDIGGFAEGALVTSSAGVVSTVTGTTGFVLTANAAGTAPSFQAAGGAGVTSVTGDTGGALTGALTFTGGTTGLAFGGAGTTETLTFAGITANGGTVSLATDATTSTINVGTGGGVKTSTFGSTNTTSTTTVQSGSGVLNVTSTGGALTINSGTGALGVSTDASATTVSLATGGAVKTVTLGSTNTSSSLALKYGTADFSLASATGNVIVALDTGEVTKPLQPAFSSYLSSGVTNVTGDGTLYTIICDTELFDQNADYNNSTGVFTAPVTGKYQFNITAYWLSVGVGYTNMYVTINSTTYILSVLNFGAGISGQICQTCSILLPMTATDTAKFQATGAGTTKTMGFNGGAGGAGTFFSGYLAC